MKVLSCIIANQTLKDIPNKYIRVIAGYPLICYTMYSLKYCKYSSEVVAFTDSQRTVQVLDQYKYKHDCPGNIDNYDWDIRILIDSGYTLFYEDIFDKACELLIENDYKYVYGNSYDGEHVFTIENKNGKGQSIFVLSKHDCFTIDKYKEFYSINPDPNLKVGFYVNGNNTRGLGHIYRTLDIADDFYNLPDIYYDINQTNESMFGETSHKLIPVNGNDELLKKCKEKQYTIFINDILQTPVEYMHNLRDVLPNAKIVNIEDDGPGSLLADVVINALLYKNTNPKTYYGANYYSGDESFVFYLKHDAREKVKNVFVSFGGADPQNYTLRLLKIISSKKYKEFNFNVVAGKANNSLQEIIKYNELPNINILFNVRNMAELMAKADIAISSRGSVCYELATMCIPTISIAQNGNEMKHHFISSENGFYFIGLNPNDKVIEEAIDKYLYSTKEFRQELIDILKKLDLSHGRKRVMDLINFG